MSSTPNNQYDTIVVGGGLVGAAVALGLPRRGQPVAVLDGGDRDFRASRGNFGLVWVQGKGADYAPYARWSGIAARCWPEFASELLDATGIDVGFEQTGGYDFCLDQDEWDARAREMALVPRQPPVLAGSGPLLLLLAWQYLRAGIEIRAIAGTPPRQNRLRARRHLPPALGAASAKSGALACAHR